MLREDYNIAKRIEMFEKPDGTIHTSVSGALLRIIFPGVSPEFSLTGWSLTCTDDEKKIIRKERITT